MKKRLLFYKLSKYFEAKEAIVITGMRQVGKTTLLKQIFDEIGEVPKLWFDFDNPLDQKTFEDIDYESIYKRLKGRTKDGRLNVFVDEIQNYPEITKIIKYLIDHYQVKFFVTGSSNYYVKNLFPESLSGRKFLFDLLPFSFQEYLYFKDQKKLEEILDNDQYDIDKKIEKSNLFSHKKYESFYETFLEFGGLPEVAVTDDFETKKLILRNIFKSFFEKDIKILADYSDVRELRDLLFLLVPRVGSMLDVSKLASELSVDRTKIYKYLEFLQSVFMIKLIPKFSKSIDRSVAGGRKVYFSDTGLLSVIGKVNEAQIFENNLVNQLGQYGELSFYSKRNIAEIDTIVDGKYAFEIKLTGTKEDYKKLVNLSKKLGIEKCFVLSRSFREEKGILTPVEF